MRQFLINTFNNEQFGADRFNHHYEEGHPVPPPNQNFWAVEPENDVWAIEPEGDSWVIAGD